jgi:tRNA-specific 2-thiouridylase
VGIDAGTNSLTVGPRDALQRDSLTASKVNWIAGEAPSPGTRVTAKIRYRHREAAAAITPLDTSRVAVTFDEPQLAITPGQAVVFYDNDAVVGGGWID